METRTLPTLIRHVETVTAHMLVSVSEAKLAAEKALASAKRLLK